MCTNHTTYADFDKQYNVWLSEIQQYSVVRETQFNMDRDEMN